MKQIWKDTALTLSASTNYTIETGGKVVFTGRCDMQPDGTCEILTNKACQYWLKQNFPTETGVTRNSDALKTFYINDAEGRALATEQFLADWSYEDITDSAVTLSLPINGILDPRMKLFWTAYNEEAAIADVASPCFDNPPTPPAPVYGDELALRIVSGGTLDFYDTGYSPKDIMYSIDGGLTWTEGRFGNSGTTHTILDVEAGDVVMVMGNNPAYGYAWVSAGIVSYPHCKFRGTALFNVSGKIMSLVYGGNPDQYDFGMITGYTFEGLFSQSGVVSASGLTLPYDTTEHCYDQMFWGCSNLIDAPQIHGNIADYACNEMFEGCVLLEEAPDINATSIGNFGCQGMFRGCLSIENAPEINATSIGDYGCGYMFHDCSGMTTAPIIHATTLGYAAMQYMFLQCRSLVEAPEILPATELTTSAYTGMFQECYALTTAPQLPATTGLAPYCYCKMFAACTSLETAPDLLAETMVTNCYYQMFYGCTVLNYVKCLRIYDTSPAVATGSWLYGVSATGTFIKHPDATWNRNAAQIPVDWTVYDA